MLYILGMLLALALGVYIGLGWPGLNIGRNDRVVRGSRRGVRRTHTPLDWLKPPKIRR